MLERAVTDKIMLYLKDLPDCFRFKEHGGQYGTSGIPDIICCYKGRFVAFEVKRPKSPAGPEGKLTKLQEMAIRDIMSAGGVAVKVTSLDEVKAVIAEIDNGSDTSRKDKVVL